MIGEIGRFIEVKVYYFGESERVNEIEKLGFEIEKVENLSERPEDCITLIFFGESIRYEKINEYSKCVKEQGHKILDNIWECQRNLCTIIKKQV